MADNLEQTEEGAVAFAFASALARGDFTGAYGMLMSSRREATTPEMLRTKYEQMLSYAESAAENVDVMNIEHDMPWKAPGDVACVYTAITGDDFSEAVDLLICSDGDRLAIKEIWWGRP
jgi:hypothetical protein